MQHQSLVNARQGTLRLDDSGQATNAVLLLHGTTGSGRMFLSPSSFACELFAPGAALDVHRYYIVIPDMIGAGGSSKPSDGLRAHFPNYGYRDMVRATHQLLVHGLRVNHLRLIWGGSMGGMLTWLWGETYPSMMDALMPMACLPMQISGRNYVWRRMIIDMLVNDPDYHGGNYRAPPLSSSSLSGSLRAVADLFWLMGASAPIHDQFIMPTRAASVAYYNRHLAVTSGGIGHKGHKCRNCTNRPSSASLLGGSDDPNDIVFQFQASYDYMPESELHTIQAPVLAVNTADDQINPPELRLAEKLIQRVEHGQFVLLPASATTRGHLSYMHPNLWSNLLRDFLCDSE